MNEPHTPKSLTYAECCATCQFFEAHSCQDQDGDRCDLYNTEVEPGQVCAAYEAHSIYENKYITFTNYEPGALS